MKRLFAAVAISALTLSSAAFAADTSAVSKPMDQKTQTPAVTSTTPAKPMVEDSKAKKPVVKKEKTSLNATQRPAVHLAQAPAASTAAPVAKPATDHAVGGKKAETVKKSDGKGEPAAAAPVAKPATR